jgi:hypothetical protein
MGIAYCHVRKWYNCNKPSLEPCILKFITSQRVKIRLHGTLVVNYPSTLCRSPNSPMLSIISLSDGTNINPPTDVEKLGGIIEVRCHDSLDISLRSIVTTALSSLTLN